MKTLFYLFWVLVFCFGNNLFAEFYWDRTFGGDSYDMDLGYSVQQTTDKGYIITGHTRSFGAYYGDVWLIKTDIFGNKQWDKTFGGFQSEYGNSVQQTTDGGYIITGSTSSYGAGSFDVWLIKTDASGVMQWDRTFGGNEQDYGCSVQQTMDGGYIIIGKTGSYGAGSWDVWLIKTDAAGVMQWDRTFGSTYSECGYSGQQTTDEGYIITGYIYYFEYDYDVLLIKTDASGVMQWDRIFGGIDDDKGFSVSQTTDGGYILTGETSSYGASNYDVWLIKTDDNGDKLWDKTYGGSSVDRGNSVQQTTDGGYIITGFTMSYGAGYGDVWLIKTDVFGNEQWDKSFGKNAPWQEEGRSVQQTTNEGYIITGSKYYDPYENYDVWLIYYKPDEIINPTSLSDLNLLIVSIIILSLCSLLLALKTKLKKL